MGRERGWQPKALLEMLKMAAFCKVTDDPIASGNYAAFLIGQNGMFQDLAILQDGQMAVTASGQP